MSEGLGWQVCPKCGWSYYEVHKCVNTRPGFIPHQAPPPTEASQINDRNARSEDINTRAFAAATEISHEHWLERMTEREVQTLADIIAKHMQRLEDELLEVL